MKPLNPLRLLVWLVKHTYQIEKGLLRMSQQLSDLTQSLTDSNRILGEVQAAVAALQTPEDLTSAKTQADSLKAGLTALLNQLTPSTAPTPAA